MTRTRLSKLLLSTLVVLLTSFTSIQAQYFWNSDSAFRAGAPNSGRLWGYVFGDVFYKSHADSLNRGGNNQYTNVKQSATQFQFRRIYLGYDYNISKTFSTEFLLAAEDDFNGGDLLQNNKFTPYIKLANLRWKNFLFRGNDLVFGLQPTPAFPYLTENLFTYSRPIERTITDIRRTPSFDFGLGLQGRFNSKDRAVVYGYHFLVANGSGAKPQNLAGNLYKWFYGDVFVGLLNRKLIIDYYADYQRQNWAPGNHGHAARQMNKLAVAWVDKNFTIGTEGFINNLKQCETGINGATKDTLDGKSSGITFYAHVNIVKTKLRAWARYDLYNPNTNYDHSAYTKYATLYGVSTSYEPNNKERFLSIGIDYMPVNNVHVMPNLWYNKYIGQQANLVGAAAKDHDLVWRLTFYFTFGKLFQNPNYSYYPFLH
ncbi:MAG: hypothetical protein JST47_01980 [Bacteroidetes bacterium]|nr:hypothetical protein [Bacteroidota bacterium]